MIHPAPRLSRRSLAAALASVAVAVLVRMSFLGVMHGRLVWLTFYPAVMVAALLGGFWAGVLAAALSCLTVLWGLPHLTGRVYLLTFADWLGMAFFFGTEVLVSGIAESMHRAREREREAAAERDRFFSLSLDMLCIANADGYFKRLSPAFADTLGWSLEELMKNPFIDFVHPDDREATLAQVRRQVEAGEKVMQFVNRYRHKDGSWRWLSWKSVPQPGGLRYATARDVTELKLAEQALRRSEENLAVTLDSIGDAVLATDTAGRVTWANPVAEALTGWTQGDANGRPIAEVFSIINEETRLPAVIPVDKVLATGETHGLANHTVLIARDGSERPIADSAAPIRGPGGGMRGVVLVFRDVTEEKRAERALLESERRLRILNEDLERRVEERTAEMRQALTTLDATEDGAFIFDPDSLRFSYVNEGAMRQLGYTRAELLGLAANQIMPDCSEQAFRALLAPVLDGRRRTHVLTGTHRRKDGHDLPVEINMQFVAPEGERPRFIFIARDITERRRIERQAFRSQRLESLGMLAGGVAHDLNNALAPILMGVAALKAKFPGSTELADLFEASAKRGAAMVRQLLTFAKGAEGERRSIHVDSLLRDLRTILNATFPKTIQLNVQCAPELPTVLGDGTQMHQVLLNLCVNARDAMPGGGLLSVDAKVLELDASAAGALPEARPGRFVALQVRDTGPGIPAQILDRIFDPFFTTKAPDKGTGLGLSTALGIMKGHRGFLHAYSRPGQGSIFTAYFPAEEASADVAPPVPDASGWRGDGETVLFVDDEAIQREIARMVLGRLNLRTITGTDGADGLILVAEHRPQLRAVITDMHMPFMDGITFVRAIRRMLPEIPVVVASGRLEEAEQEALAALKVTAVLAKPYTEGQLVAVLRDLFRA